MVIVDNRRIFGEHLTSSRIFEQFIFPEIKDKLFDYLWIDLYAGEGNLILPILTKIPRNEREEFFKEHIFLSDIQEKMVNKCIEIALNYGIDENIVKKKIVLRDNLKDFPEFIHKFKYPIFHITNPPYLYLGYIRKNKKTQKYLQYFDKGNKGYQDLYQIAMINDLRNNLIDLIYIIPSNFLFGASISNKFRKDFLKFYKILKIYTFETQIFEFTGTNICISFLKRKKNPKPENLKFYGTKIKKQNKKFVKNYILKPEFKYRAGSEFYEFIKYYRTKCPLIVKYYLQKNDISKKKGNNFIKVIDANNYHNNEYKKMMINVNDELKEIIKSNILYIRTIDSGSEYGRVGIGIIKDDFNVDGIFVSGNTYRTHPIQIFLVPTISIEDQYLLKDYFNSILEYFRKKLDSEFLTTYKYSNAEYTRKYLGLTQVRSLIETFPILDYGNYKNQNIKKIIKNKEATYILNKLKNYSNLEKINARTIN